MEAASKANDVTPEVQEYQEGAACILDEDGNCLMCGS
jgi:hypothetical protein